MRWIKFRGYLVLMNSKEKIDFLFNERNIKTQYRYTFTIRKKSDFLKELMTIQYSSSKTELCEKTIVFIKIDEK